MMFLEKGAFSDEDLCTQDITELDIHHGRLLAHVAEVQGTGSGDGAGLQDVITI